MIDEIKSQMARSWNIDETTIPENASLNEFQPWDSINHISLLLALEEAYGLEVNGETIQSLWNIESIVVALENLAAGPDQLRGRADHR